MGRIIEREITKHPFSLWELDYEDVLPYLKTEVQKPWGLSMSTTLDYARIVFIGNERQFKAELKKFESKPSDEK